MTPDGHYYKLSPLKEPPGQASSVVMAIPEGATANGPPASPWPIYNGFDHQPTENELRALHEQDVTPAQADEIDKLYDQLMSADKKILGSHNSVDRGSVPSPTSLNGIGELTYVMSARGQAGDFVQGERQRWP